MADEPTEVVTVQGSRISKHHRHLMPALLSIMIVPAIAVPGIPSPGARDSVIKIVTQIQRADYEGDRPALKQLFEQLAPFTAGKDLASRVHYWRGFALWRRVLNGFNESVEVKEQERDLQQAIDEFEKASALDSAFADAKIGAESCLSLLMGQNRGDPARFQALMTKAAPLRKEAEASAPNNPRLQWVLGTIFWNVPADRGGGQARAIEAYEKGLAAARIEQRTVTDPLEPSWGEPELLMSLAGSYLYRTTPDFDAAERYARSALELVPYWHYVRDILLLQIRDAKIKAAH